MPTATQRLDYLDAVRSFALLLGIVFHASLSFMPMYIGWAVMDVSTSNFVALFVQISHSFRMELFFLIAGFFSHLTFHRKGFPTFAKSRLVRIGIPFAVGWFILRPLVVSGWIMGAESMRGEVNIQQGLIGGFQTLNTLPTGMFVGTHLWFLYYILIITAATLGIRALLNLAPKFQASITDKLDHATRWIAHTKMAFPVLAIPTAACLWFMDTWGMDTPDKSLLPHLPVFLSYSGFFGFGWMLHRQSSLLGELCRLSIGRFALGAAGITGVILLSSYEGNPGHPQFTLFRAGFALSYTLCMWSLVLLSIGIFRKYVNRPRPFIRYIADSSYWLYLVHLPIVIWLQIAFAELEFNWSIKLAAISLLTVGLSLFMYDLLVRPTLVGKILNGSRKKSYLLSLLQLGNAPSLPQPPNQIPATTSKR